MWTFSLKINNMKRKNFLLSILALPFLGFRKKEEANEKKLTQIKPFNKATVTQAIAAEIMSLVAWNHLNEERFANSFKITQHLKDTEIINGKRGGVMWRDEGEEIYPRAGEILTEENGITIYSPTTCQEVRIFSDGDWTCRLITEELNKIWPRQYENIVRNIKTGEERIEKRPNSGHRLGQIKVIELYLKLGFYQYK
jgi:hypothetical protein